MELFEIYYHDEWRTPSSYTREHIASSAEDAKQWLLEHLDDWYDNEDDVESNVENDVEIDDIIEQGLDEEFIYMTIKKITVNSNGSVEWE